MQPAGALRVQRRGRPTTPTTASVIGAIQAQEVVKHLHGLETLSGRGYVFEGLGHASFTVNYPIAPDCPWHGESIEIKANLDFGHDTSMRRIIEYASRQLGGLDAIDLSRELIDTLDCPSCAQSNPARKPADSIREDQVLCPRCGSECVPRFFHSLTPESPLSDSSPAELGLPRWDILWARHGEKMLGIEMSADADSCLTGDPDVG